MIKENQQITESVAQNASEQISSEALLGKLLRQKREELKMEPREVSVYLKIKLNDVIAIEEGRLDAVTKHLYVPGLMKAYARFLKLDEKLVSEKTKLLPIKSNVENKKHLLVNIGENTELTPDKDMFFNFLLATILLFFVLLSIYNSSGNKDSLVTGKGLIQQLESTTGS